MAEEFYLKTINYHYIRDVENTPFPALKAVACEDFVKQIDLLARENDMISWDDLKACVETGRALPEKACLLTFDDGLKEHYSAVFPLLKKLGISALFFPIARENRDSVSLAHKLHFLLAAHPFGKVEKSLLDGLDAGQKRRYAELKNRYSALDLSAAYYDNVNVSALKKIMQDDMYDAGDAVLSDVFKDMVGSEKDFSDKLYLKIDEMKDMAAGGMSFGGHGSKHIRFSVLDSRDQEREIRLSRELLMKFTKGPWPFSYPYGAFSGTSPDVLKGYGFIAAFTVENKTLQDNFYSVGRVDARFIEVPKIEDVRRRAE